MPTDLVMFFRSQGVQWPLRSGDTVRVRRYGETLGEISADLLIDLVVHHFRSLHLQERLRHDVIHGPQHGRALEVGQVQRIEDEPAEPTPIPKALQDARRAKRKGKRS